MFFFFVYIWVNDQPGPQMYACGVHLNKRRFIGERPALIDEYSWIVALLNPDTGTHICGGSVVTAGNWKQLRNCV